MNTHEIKNLKRNAMLGVVVIALIAFGALWRPINPELPPKPINITLSDKPLFSEGLSSAGITADTIGFHRFSDDGKYFFFNTFTEGATPANQAHLLDLATGSVVSLLGTAERAIDDSRVMQLYSKDGMVLYDTLRGEAKTYELGENIFWGSLSPDGKRYVVNTFDGVRIINRETDTVSNLSENRFDGAYAWFSDSTRILGFRANSTNLYEAGNGRDLGIWNLTDNSFTEIPFEPEAIRIIFWIVPDRIARVNTGWDDGSYDYLVDITTGQVVDLGETSSALMGGMAQDSARGLFAILEGESLTGAPKARIYKGLDLIGETPLASGYFREGMSIIDEGRMIYIRKTMGDQGVTAQSVVQLDLLTGVESVVAPLPLAYSYLSLAPDHKTWVASSENQFITGILE